MGKVNFYKLPKNFFLYRNKSLIFKDDINKDLYRHHVLLNIYNNPNFIIDLLNKTNLFVTKYFRGYYIERKGILQTVRKRKFEVDRISKYEEIKEKLPFIKYTKYRLDMYQNNNTVIDTYCYWKLFELVYSNKKTFATRLPLFIPFITEVLSRVSPYKNIIIPFTPNELITNGRVWSLENLIYFLIKNKLITNFAPFNNVHFIATTKKGNIFFKFKLDDNFDVMRYRRLSNILAKINKGMVLDASEQELYNSDTDASDKISDTEEDTPPTSVINKNISNVKNVVNNITAKEEPEVLASNIIQVKSHIEQEKTNKPEVKVPVKQAKIEKEQDFKKAIDNSFNKDIELDTDIPNELVTNDTLADYDLNNIINQKRIERLKQKQSEVTLEFNGKPMSIDELIESNNPVDIVSEEMPIDTINKEIRTSKLGAIDKVYNEKQKLKDFALMITAFNNDKECPTYITSIKKEDSSTSFDKKETYTVKMADGWGNTHSLTFDMPVIIDNSFMYVNGNKKIIGKQLVQLPIIKTKPDEVCITTNYNKMYIYRVGQKTSAYTDRLLKYLNTNQNVIRYKTGNIYAGNSEYINTLEYDDFSKVLLSLTLKDINLFFSRKSVEDNIVKINKNIKPSELISETEYLLGTKGSNVIIIDFKNDKVNVINNKKNIIESYESIFDLISSNLKEINPKEYENLMSTSVSKRFMYTRTKLSGQWVPLIILMGFYFGLEKTMIQYGIDYEFSEKRRRLDAESASNLSMIPFNNGYLYYNSSKLKNSILMNGLLEMPTKEIDFETLNNYEGYFEFFESAYNSRNASKGFKNNLDMLLDPKTVEILKYLKLPDTLIGVLLYANTLLDDNSYTLINSMKNYRLRSLEMVNDHLYKAIAESFKTYKDEHKSGRKEAKINIQKDIVIKSLLESPIVEEYSVLSPIFEVEKLAATNYKGLSGTNLDQAFTPAMRQYDKSMMGLVGLSTPDSDKVGISRTLSYNPKVNNTLGIIDTESTTNEMDGTNLFTTAELMTGYNALHDDPPRIAMQTQQYRHVVPTKKQSKSLYGSGLEKTLPFNISSDFVTIAKNDGIVESIDEKNELVVLKYKDNSRDIIDISDLVSKNSNGGFYISNNKTCLYKKGEHFKKGDIVAKNNNFFLGEKGNDNISFAKGLLTKIAVLCGDFTLEDSSIITEDLSNDMACDVTMMKPAVFGANTNIKYIVKKHQHIKSGEPLITFEHSFDDADANKTLDALDDSFTDFIEGLGVNSITSKYTGEIVDIKIYWNIDENLFSPSIKKIIKDYKEEINRRKKILDKSDNNSTILPATEKINSNRIKGREIEGLLIEFYIRHEDKLKVGDKIAFECALKTIVCDVIPKGNEPYSESRKDEPIKAILSPMSIISRMTTSIYSNLYTNKLIVEMKRKAAEIWNE